MVTYMYHTLPQMCLNGKRVVDWICKKFWSIFPQSSLVSWCKKYLQKCWGPKDTSMLTIFPSLLVHTGTALSVRNTVRPQNRCRCGVSHVYSSSTWRGFLSWTSSGETRLTSWSPSLSGGQGLSYQQYNPQCPVPRPLPHFISQPLRKVKCFVAVIVVTFGITPTLHFVGGENKLP